MQTFNTQLEFLDAVRPVWQAQAVDFRLIDALKSGMKEADLAEKDAKFLPDGSLNLRIKGWVLRSEDIPVIEAIGIVATADTVALGPEGFAASAAISATASLAGLCWKAWRKGGFLSLKEVAVLGFLETHGPMELEELARKATAHIRNLGEDEIKKTVISLTDVELRNGKVVELVRMDQSGRWRVKPI